MTPPQSEAMTIRHIRRKVASWILPTEDRELIKEALDLYADIMARRNVTRKDEDHDHLSVRILIDHIHL
jgi:hypothetical protein